MSGSRLKHVGFLYLFLFLQIFFPGSKPAANMPLLFIYIQNLPCLARQGWIELYEAFGYVFMHCTLANPELLRRLPYGGSGLDNVESDFYCTLFDIILQREVPQRCRFYILLRGGTNYAPH